MKDQRKTDTDHKGTPWKDKSIRQGHKQEIVKNITTDLTVATWNVRGTYEEGSLRNLIGEIQKYKYDVVAVQEIKQVGTKL